jgi:hydrogenase maturation protease
MNNPLVIGIGNIYRGDDGAGLLVARRVEEIAPETITVREHSGDGLALMDMWQAVDSVILIDAVKSGAEPGKIFRFDAGKHPLPGSSFFISTHAINVAEGIEIKRSLNQLPPRLIVYGIEGKNFHAGLGLSAEVEAAVPVVADRVLDEIGIMSCSGQEP